jgi:hypothetical protein
MRTIRRLLIAVVALGAAGLTGLAADDARADGGFFFGVGTSFGHRHGHYHGGYHRWRHHHYPRHSLWGYGYRPWYQPRYQLPPRTVYILPPPQPAPRVLVQPAPQAAPAPVFAYDTSYCREYSRTAVVNGAPVEIYGTACRQPDGSWRIVN